MSGGAQPRNADPELARLRLSESLDSCRSLVSNYRAMLGGRVLAENPRHDQAPAESPRQDQPLARPRRR